MNNPALSALIQNSALLLLIVVVFDIIIRQKSSTIKPLNQIFIGIIIGGLCIGLILTSYHLEPGIVFDTRSILLSISGLFFGIIPTLVAMALTVTFRLWQGGVGAWTGILVILATGGLGIIWHRYRRSHLENISVRELYIFGVIVHLVMIVLMLTLPWSAAERVLTEIALPVMIVHPIVTTALGLLLASRLRREKINIALIESESKYRILVENIPQKIFTKDRNSVYMSANEKFAEDFNLTAVDLIGKTDDDLFPGDLSEKYKADDNRIMDTGMSEELEELYIKEEKKYYVQTIKTPIEDNAGNIIGILGIFWDVTERKQAENALIESEKRAKDQRDALVELTLDKDIIDGTIDFALNRMVKVMSATLNVERASVWMLSSDKSELRNLTLYESDKKKYSKGDVLMVAEFPRYFEAIKAENRIYAEDAQTDPRTKELNDFYLIPIGITSLLDAGIFVKGNLVGVVSFEHIGNRRNWYADEEAFVSTLALLVAQWLVSDEHKQAVKMLRQSEEKFSSAFQNSPFLMTISDFPDGRYIEVNEKFLHFYSITREEAIGKTSLEIDIIEPQDRENLLNEFKDKGKIKQVEVKLKTKKGETVWGSVNGEFINISGKQGMLAIIEDITERKQAEEKLKHSLEEKKTLLRELYHRTRNNMQVIIALLLLHSRKSEDQKSKQILSDINNRIRSMALVHQKLYKSKNLSYIDLKEYITDLFDGLCDNLNVNKDKISFVLDIGSIPVLIDIAIPCGLVLNELLSNSLKHAFPDNRNGCITIIAEKNSNSKVNLHYSDDGIGFPENYDLKNSNTMGIEIINMILEYQLKGKMNIHSKEGMQCDIIFEENNYIERVADENTDSRR